MKKLLLTFGLALLGTGSFAQVIFTVEAPASISGSYNFTYASGWGADLSLTANSVLDTVMLADDSLACTAITNDLTGKVALVYRGTCEFGAKALAAQNAGAVAVIIVNNIPGAPIAMGAGAVGGSVTIPVAMISQADGAIIHDQLLIDDVVVFLGNKTGYYADDIGFESDNVLRTDAYGTPIQLAQNASEFNTTVGAWVFNYGSNNQTAITLNAVVDNGTEVYNETSDPFDISSGDSLWVALPDFNLPSYTAGVYTLTYTVTNASTDEYTADNTIDLPFSINDSMFSLSRLDAQGMPVSDGGIRPNPNNSSFSSCIVFNNPNGSRLGAAGMAFNASTTTTDSLTGQEIVLVAYRWDDVFADMNDANLGFTALTEMATASYYYATDDQNMPKYQAFTTPFVMEDDQRYLFCAQTFNVTVFLGYDTESKYTQNENEDLQPLYPVESDGTYSAGGFTGGDVPALAVRVFDAADLTINENVLEASSFPNPAKDVVTVKVSTSGTAVLTITDLAGRTVATQDVTIANGQFAANVAGFNAGTYVFSLAYANGANSQFKVVVTK
jgi:hypothetical protein